MNENLVRVVYMHGLLEGEGKIKTLDTIEDTIEVCKSILNDWGNFIDIENAEEEGYVMAYARRKLIELENTPTEFLTEEEMLEVVKGIYGSDKNYENDLFVDYATKEGYAWNEENRNWYK